MASSGNFMTLNPLKYKASSYTTSKISHGNLRIDEETGNAAQFNVGLKLGDGKFYWELYITDRGGSSQAGVCVGHADTNNYTSGGAIIGNTFESSKLLATSSSGNSSTSSYGSNFVATDIIGIAMDFTNSTMEYFKNNSSQGSFSFSGANDGTTYYPYVYCNHGLLYMNAGQDSSFVGQKTSGSANASDENGFGDFYYTPPSGFLAVCSANLPISDDIDPAQTDTDYPSKQFNAVAYTGDGTTSNAISVGFQPDLVWIKQRSPSADYSNSLVDSSRGRDKVIYSQRTGAEVSTGSTQDVVSFDSNGFTLGTNNQTSSNNDGREFVAWCWRANGGVTTTDTSGDISTVRQSNTASGFAILTWSGNGSNNQRLPHGLGKKPAFVIAKRRDASQSWGVWTQYLGANSKELQLNSNSAEQSSGNAWYQSGMTTDFVGIGSDRNISSSTNVAYVWADVEGMQKFGTYIGNNTDNDGPFVYTGFRPRMIVIKGATEAYSWFVFDSARNTHNLVDKHVRWDGADAEATEPTGARKVDFLSNGFKVMADAASINGDGDTYVYMAWADTPFKYNNTF